jgi:hypothetical protein
VIDVRHHVAVDHVDDVDGQGLTGAVDLVGGDQARLRNHEQARIEHVPECPPNTWPSVAKLPAGCRWEKPVKKTKVKLWGIAPPPPGTRGVVKSSVAPAFKGTGDRDYHCAGCDVVLMVSMERGQIQGLVIGCPCGQYNEIPITENTN